MIKRTGEKRTVIPLEDITFGLPVNPAESPMLKDAGASPQEGTEVPKSASDMPSLIRSFYATKAAPGQIILRSNQKGVTFEGLFSPYLVGAKRIEVTDPYIKNASQLRNFVEFVALVYKLRDAGDEIQLILNTAKDDDYAGKIGRDLDSLADSLEGTGVLFSYNMNSGLHDRSIVLDNGWKIVLGRGLDIWQKTNGQFDIAEKYQEMRMCKDCEITILRV
jgi:ATP-dependent Lon protease